MRKTVASLYKCINYQRHELRDYEEDYCDSYNILDWFKPKILQCTKCILIQSNYPLGYFSSIRNYFTTWPANNVKSNLVWMEHCNLLAKQSVEVLLKGLSWNLVQTFVVPKRRILPTLVTFSLATWGWRLRCQVKSLHPVRQIPMKCHVPPHDELYNVVDVLTFHLAPSSGLNFFFC